MSRRVRTWLSGLESPDYVVTDEERSLHEADHLSMVTDDGRARSITLLFRTVYADIAPPLAEQNGLDLVPVDRVRVTYDYHLRRAHADTLRLPAGARIRFSADMVNILFAWIRNACSMLSAPDTVAEDDAVVISRVARALDLATAPMFWTRQYWSTAPYHSGVAESFVQSAERFVLAHEIAHIYQPDEVLAVRMPDWGALDRRQRGHRRELEADAVGLAGLFDHARQFATREGSDEQEVLVHGALGAVLALTAMDLLERYDASYAGGDYPRVVTRRAAARSLVRSLGHAVADRVEDFETAADRVAGRALTVALRRRQRAARAVSALVAGRDGSATWTEAEFDHAMLAVLRHSRRGALDALSAAMTNTADERVAGFVRRFLVEWQGEPVYLPFLQDIGWGES